MKSEVKKITYVITRSDIGGAQFHTLALIGQFKKDYDLLLIVGSDGVLSDQVRKIGVRVEIVPELDSLNFLFAIFKLYKILRNEKPNLVHVHSTLASIYGRVASKLAHIKVLYTVHGWHFSHEPSRVKKTIKVVIERALKRCTDHWITVSEFDKRLGEKCSLFRVGHVTTVPNGVLPSQRIRVDVPPNTSPLSVVFVGRATYQKNCESAVKVIEHTIANVHLTMYASNGNVNEIKALIDNSSAKEKIALVMNEPNAAQKIHKHSVMLVTSRYEGMPLSVLEAMREGLAIISTDVCGMNEVVYDEQNGYLLPEYSEKKMAVILDQLSVDSKKLNTMGQKSRSLFNDKFTLAQMLKSTGEIYHIV